MRIFGFEITVQRVRPEDSPEQKMKDGCDLVNEAWEELIAEGDTSLRPWVLWDEKRMVLSRFAKSKPVIYHE